MRTLPFALGITDIEKSVQDSAQRAGCSPVLVMPGEAARWRMEALNIPIRHAPKTSGTVRYQPQ